MGFSDSWHRTLVYFGLAEDRTYDEEEEQPAAIRAPEAELVTRKAVAASPEEAEHNPRSRSARLRVARKLRDHRPEPGEES